MRQRSSRAGYQHVFHYVRQHPGETGSDQSGTKERETMKSNLSNLEQIKKDLETKKSNLKSYVAQLDQNLSEIEQNIADLKSQITAKEEEITQTQEELDAAQAKEDAQKDAMIHRIRVMYEKEIPIS